MTDDSVGPRPEHQEISAEGLFELANVAFDLFSLGERRAALRHFASLRYARLEDAFIEAVHRVVRSKS